LREKPLDAASSLDLLGRLRRASDHLVLTGGEPLQHSEIDAILAGLPALGFRSVTFTTNGFALEEHLPALAGSITELVVSLDTLNESQADACFGAGSGVFKRILAGLEKARTLSDRRFRILISAVVRPENLDDLPELLAWTQAQGFSLAACPQLMGVKAHAALAEDSRYQAFFDALITCKRQGGLVHGSTRYLEYMRDLRAFRCRPFAVVATSPQGYVFYPCLEKGTHAGNLLEMDLDEIMAQGLEWYGPAPQCGNQCHSACALGFATALDHPFSLVWDGIRQLLTSPFTRGTGLTRRTGFTRRM
jgi:MoaA/NifB/PqqE/SkfB family radical SAM enzyme